MAKILVIDPDKLRLMRVCNVLIARGFHVVTAPSPHQAVARIRVENPDLVILGSAAGQPPIEETILWIRSTPAGLNAPIIAISNAGHTQESTGLLRLGADKVLRAECTDGALVAHVDTLLDRRMRLATTSPDTLWAMAEPSARFDPKS